MAHTAVGKHFKGLFHDRQIVFRHGARIGPRVGQGLMPLIQALCNRQRGLGRKTKLAIGFTLQRGQVKQLAWRLRGWFGLFRDRGGFAAHRIGDSNCFLRGPEAVSLQLGIGLCAFATGCIGGGFFPLWIKPLAGVRTSLGEKGGVDFPIITADELADFFFALNHD